MFTRVAVFVILALLQVTNCSCYNLMARSFRANNQTPFVRRRVNNFARRQQQQQQQQNSNSYNCITSHCPSILILSSTNNNNNNDKNDDTTTKLKQLGFTESELKQASSTDTEERAKLNVKVSIIPNVDAVTLTAIGFTLIGLNFFLFANLGDGGIAGIVATISNLASQ